MAEESETMSKDGGSDASTANNSNGNKIDNSGDTLHMNGSAPPPNNGSHHHHHHHHHLHKKDLNLPPPESDFYNNNEQQQHLKVQQSHGGDDGLGPLPVKWEKAYTDNGEAYFIDHNTGTSHWLDPRLSKFQKKSLEDCSDDELPYGWEKICDPQYGTYFIDHVNRKTQYENPVLQAKRMAERGSGPNNGNLIMTRPPPNPNDIDRALFTKNPSELSGEKIFTTLVKSTRGLGFTIVGGDDNVEEFLQIKSIVPNGPAWLDGKLKMGDVLVFVNDICVLGFTHHEMVNIFQSILPGEQVALEVCRGYPLPYLDDPNTEVVTTIAVDGLNNPGVIVENDMKYVECDPDIQHKNPLAKIQAGANANGGDVYFNDTLMYQQHYKSKNNNFDIPEILHINIVKGDMGFGFTIADSSYGQKVKKILDRQCCKNLMEGDILLSINSISVKNMTHNEVVQVLKDCPKNIETTLKVQRGQTLLGVGGGSTKMTNKLRKSIEMAKFGGGMKKDGFGFNNNNNLFRSKTPTADLYSTQSKEILPTRPKTPLVDTRARVKTPSLPIADLNTDEIELDVNKNNDPKIDLNLNIKSNGSYQDNDSINNDIALYHGEDQYTKVTERLGELTINSNSTSESIYLSQHQFVQNVPNYNRNYNPIYSQALVPPPPIPPSSSYHHPQQLLQPTYHHDNCFCFECKEYQRQQHQLMNRPYNVNGQMAPVPYNLPPQMSDNIGKKLNDYLMDRKRSIQSNNQYELYQQQPIMPHSNSYDQNFYNPHMNWKSNSSSQHSPQQYVHNNYQNVAEDYTLTEVTLERQALGFGFRIVGGTEEGSQVTVGHIVPGGAADKDTRIATGDEILNINGVNVENSSHHRVVQLMGEAGLRGQVTMILRRRNAANKSVKYPYNVIVSRNENEGFGFVIISSSSQYYGSSIGKLIPGSPAERCGELKIGDRIIAVNGIDITGLAHGEVVNLIKESGLQVQLTIGSQRENNNQMPVNSTSTTNSTSTNASTNNDGMINTLNNNTRYPIIS